MAFLCPSRMGRHKKKKKEEKAPLPGRLTGSASIDTLVRVGLEKSHGLNPDARMVVQQDFSPLTKDEVPVKKGQEVQLVYSENDWAYIITDRGEEGFVPVPYLTPSLIVNKFKIKRRPYPLSPEDNLAFDDVFDDNDDEDDEDDNLRFPTPPAETVKEKEVDVGKGRQPLEQAAKGRELDTSSHSASTRSASIESNPQPEVRLFRKHFCGHYVVVFDFTAADEDDISVGRAEMVTVLNVEDSDWWWIRRGSGEEGFVPRSFILPLPAELDTSNSSSSRNNSKRNAIAIHHHTQAVQSEHVVQILVSREYQARSQEELTVRAGDVIFVDYSKQPGPAQQLRVFCPRLSRYGLLPRSLFQTTKEVGGSTSTVAIAL